VPARASQVGADPVVRLRGNRPEGAALQRASRDKAFEKGIRFIGPNSVGVANLHEKVIPSISQVFDQAGLARVASVS
jgi:acyl-CoA synthetase (NDP forming)